MMRIEIHKFKNTSSNDFRLKTTINSSIDHFCSRGVAEERQQARCLFSQRVSKFKLTLLSTDMEGKRCLKRFEWRWDLKVGNKIFLNINALPKPKCAFTPPKFLTRNSPAFLKLQFIEKPKSDSRTQVHWIWLMVPGSRGKGKKFD